MTHPRLAGLGTLLGRQAGARGFRSRMPFLFVCVCLVLLAGCASSGIDKDALVPVSDVLAAERAVVASGGASYDYVIARRDQLNITVYLRSG